MIERSRLLNMEIWEGGNEAYPHLADGVGVGGLPCLAKGNNVVTRPGVGKGGHDTIGVMTVLAIDVLPDSRLSALTHAGPCSCARHRMLLPVVESTLRPPPIS